MGILDTITEKVKEGVGSIPGNPMPTVEKALVPPAAATAPAKTPQQVQYEATEKFMNRNNPAWASPEQRTGGLQEINVGEPIQKERIP